MVFVCELCGYEYNEKNGDIENGVAEDTAFDELPNGWCCPLCGAGKEDFEKLQDAPSDENADNDSLL